MEPKMGGGCRLQAIFKVKQGQTLDTDEVT